MADPRFRRQKNKHSKVKIDARFTKMFKDKDFGVGGEKDRYGRQNKERSHDASLRSFYHLSSEDEVDVEDENLLNEESLSDDVSDYSDVSNESDSEDHGLSINHPLALEDVEYGDHTNRLAVCNLDWDKINASDLFQLLDSFKPALGRVLRVTIHTSDFGKERLKYENENGPLLDEALLPGGKNPDAEENSASECKDEDTSEENEDASQLALKKYHIERLKYYFAIVECDSIDTATELYERCDGTEFEKSGNFLDLRFIPDSQAFPIDEFVTSSCNERAEGYRAKNFATAALLNLKQRLAWDEDDADRVRITKRDFSRDCEEEDFAAFLAPASDIEEQPDYKSIFHFEDSSTPQNPFARGKETDDDELADMEVTFDTGLDSLGSELLKKKQEKALLEEATPFEKQIMRHKEKRKLRRKELREAYLAENESAQETQGKDKISRRSTKHTKKRKHDDSNFKVDVNDSRFKDLFESDAFAIDPTDPAFRKTEGMEELLRKKRSGRSEN